MCFWFVFFPDTNQQLHAVAMFGCRVMIAHASSEPAQVDPFCKNTRSVLSLFFV